MSGSSTATSKAGSGVESCGGAPNHSVVYVFLQKAATHVPTKQASWPNTTKDREQGVCVYTSETTEKAQATLVNRVNDTFLQESAKSDNRPSEQDE